MIECHTPFKDKVEEYRGKWVMINGHGVVHEVAEHYGFSHVITTEEYSSLFPEVKPLITSRRDEGLKRFYRERF
jgi:hypothetical protein